MDLTKNQARYAVQHCITGDNVARSQQATLESQLQSPRATKHGDWTVGSKLQHVVDEETWEKLEEQPVPLQHPLRYAEPVPASSSKSQLKGLLTFRSFYALQHDRLEQQKQSLADIQKLQKETARLRGASRSVQGKALHSTIQPKDLDKLRGRFEALKQ
jgi:hypothetical protein